MSKPTFKTQEEVLTQEVKDVLDQIYSGLISVSEAVFVLHTLDVILVSYRGKDFIISCLSDWTHWKSLDWDVWAMHDAPENFYVTL